MKSRTLKNSDGKLLSLYIDGVSYNNAIKLKRKVTSSDYADDLVDYYNNLVEDIFFITYSNGSWLGVCNEGEAHFMRFLYQANLYSQADQKINGDGGHSKSVGVFDIEKGLFNYLFKADKEKRLMFIDKESIFSKYPKDYSGKRSREMKKISFSGKRMIGFNWDNEAYKNHFGDSVFLYGVESDVGYNSNSMNPGNTSLITGAFKKLKSKNAYYKYLSNFFESEGTISNNEKIKYLRLFDCSIIDFINDNKLSLITLFKHYMLNNHQGSYLFNLKNQEIFNDVGLLSKVTLDGGIILALLISASYFLFDKQLNREELESLIVKLNDELGSNGFLTYFINNDKLIDDLYGLINIEYGDEKNDLHSVSFEPSISFIFQVTKAYSDYRKTIDNFPIELNKSAQMGIFNLIRLNFDVDNNKWSSKFNLFKLFSGASKIDNYKDIEDVGIKDFVFKVRKVDIVERNTDYILSGGVCERSMSDNFYPIENPYKDIDGKPKAYSGEVDNNILKLYKNIHNEHSEIRYFKNILSLLSGVPSVLNNENMGYYMLNYGDVLTMDGIKQKIVKNFISSVPLMKIVYDVFDDVDWLLFITGNIKELKKLGSEYLFDINKNELNIYYGEYSFSISKINSKLYCESSNLNKVNLVVHNDELVSFCESYQINELSYIIKENKEGFKRIFSLHKNNEEKLYIALSILSYFVSCLLMVRLQQSVKLFNLKSKSSVEVEIDERFDLKEHRAKLAEIIIDILDRDINESLAMITCKYLGSEDYRYRDGEKSKKVSIPNFSELSSENISKFDIRKNASVNLLEFHKLKDFFSQGVIDGKYDISKSTLKGLFSNRTFREINNSHLGLLKLMGAGRECSKLDLFTPESIAEFASLSKDTRKFYGHIKTLDFNIFISLRKLEPDFSYYDVNMPKNGGVSNYQRAHLFPIEARAIVRNNVFFWGLMEMCNFINFHLSNYFGSVKLTESFEYVRDYINYYLKFLDDSSDDFEQMDFMKLIDFSSEFRDFFLVVVKQSEKEALRLYSKLYKFKAENMNVAINATKPSTYVSRYLSVLKNRSNNYSKKFNSKVWSKNGFIVNKFNNEYFGDYISHKIYSKGKLDDPLNIVKSLWWNLYDEKVINYNTYEDRIYCGDGYRVEKYNFIDFVIPIEISTKSDTDEKVGINYTYASFAAIYSDKLEEIVFYMDDIETKRVVEECPHQKPHIFGLIDEFILNCYVNYEDYINKDIFIRFCDSLVDSR